MFLIHDSKTGEYKPQSEEHGSLFPGNKKGEFPGFSLDIGKLENAWSNRENSVP